ncbi:MAG: hypothetical protein WCO78_03340 [Candidatus Roizmanbacteria bacterium]
MQNFVLKLSQKVNLIFILALGILVITVGRNLNPFAKNFFSYHDVSQPSRIEQFTHEVVRFNIPPQIAPDYAFRNGYPVFTFYAPTAYWITSALHLTGFEINQAIKSSFLLSILTAFAGMYMLVSHVSKDRILRLLPAFLYAASPWIASEIFVRGNLAEIWCLALLPWGVWALMRQNGYILSSIILSALFTSHNALSIVAIVFCGCIAYVQNNRRFALKIYATALVFSMYFWVPVLIGLSGTYAYDIAKLTRYYDHFLCIQQIWTTPNGWGYGGSAPGCLQDGVSFMIGKVLILTALIGLIVFLITYLRKCYSSLGKSNVTHESSALITTVLIVALGLGSLLLTLYLSQPIWSAISLLQSFQFPWRFLIFVLFSASYMSIFAFTYFQRPKHLSYGATIIVCILAIAMSSRYFVGQDISPDNAYKLYGPEFTRQKAAYTIPEYLPRTVDLNLWNRLRTRSGSKEEYARLTAQFAAYKPPTVLYTISQALSLGALGFLIWNHIYKKIQKKV